MGQQGAMEGSASRGEDHVEGEVDGGLTRKDTLKYLWLVGIHTLLVVKEGGV